MPTAMKQTPTVSSPPSSLPQSSGLRSTGVALQVEGGTFVVPVSINGAITLNFTIDSGSAHVSIPADVVLTLMRTGAIRHDDFRGSTTYTLADGSTMPSPNFNIRSLMVGGKVLENVTGSVAPVRGGFTWPKLPQPFQVVVDRQPTANPDLELAFICQRADNSRWGQGFQKPQ
jgi:hypothetical protein